MNYCTDCKHVTYNKNEAAVCKMAPKGVVQKYYNTCTSERNVAYGDCGPEGKLFEKKITFVQRVINVVTKKEK